MNKNYRILIVEDNPSDAVLIREEIRQYITRFEDLTVETERDYTAALKDFKPDLVLCDFYLPAFDGFTALSLLQELSPHVPFILVSGTANEEIAARILKLGAENFFSKGNIMQLGPAIKKALERKRFANLKIKNEEKLSILIEAVEQNPTTIMLTNTEGNIEYVNPQFTNLTGYELNEIIGKNPRILKEGSTPAHYYTDLWNTISSGQTWLGEFRNRKKNGDFYIESAVITPIKQENGMITHYLAIKEDITLKREAEDLLKGYNSQLEETVKLRTAELEEAKNEAVSADKLKTAFLLNMSHELRTPLNSIIGFTGILLQKIPGPLNEEQEKQLRMVHSSGQHLLSLISEILELSKIEAGKFSFNPEPFYLDKLIDEIIMLEKTSAEAKNLTFEFKKPLIPVMIKSDRKRLYQVMLNLVNNAIKFTDQGSVTVSYFTEDESVNINVSDTGIGIKPENIQHLFYPFSQIENSLVREHKGTGLGLSISKKIVEMLNGTISVQSEYRAGSTFTVRIPVDN